MAYSYLHGVTKKTKIASILAAAALIVVAIGIAQLRTEQAAQAEAGEGVTSGLVGLWKMNEGTGTTVADDSTNSNTGTLTNMEVGDWSTDVPANTAPNANSLDFDDVDEHVSVGDPVGGELDFGASDDFTITAWFNRDTFATEDIIIAKKNGSGAGDVGWLLLVDDSSDQLQFWVSDGTDQVVWIGTSTFLSSGWNHVAVRWDDDTDVQIYVNGQNDNATLGGGTHSSVDSIANALNLEIGAESDLGGYFDGKLDDVRVYNRILNAVEISEIAGNNPWTPAQLADLEGWWDASDNANVTKSSGDTRLSQINDKSGNANHFTPASGTDPLITDINGHQAYQNSTAENWISASAASFTGSPSMAVAVVAETTSVGAFSGDMVDFTTAGFEFVSATDSDGTSTFSTFNFTNRYGTTEKSVNDSYIALLNAPSGTGTASAVEMWDTGTQLAYQSGTQALTPSGNYLWGERNNNTNHFVGDMGELVVTDNGLSTEDRELLEGYLAWKWGTQADLPAVHPYSTTNASGPPLFNIAPGGVSTNLQLWLDANDLDGDGIPEGVAESGKTGTNISAWVDKSGNANNATSTGGTEPVFIDADINNNSTVDFVGADFVTLTSGLDASPGQFFTVGAQGGTGDFSNVFNNNSGVHLMLSDTGTTNFGAFNGSFNDSTLDLIVDRPQLMGVDVDSAGTTLQYSLNAYDALSTTSSTQTATDYDHLGNIGAGSQPFGKISEFISYSTQLSAADKQKVDSYLAIKYGITLDQSVDTDYLASDGTTLVWDSTEVDFANPENFVRTASADDSVTWASVAFGNGIFVAVNESNSTFMHSRDGSEWTSITVDNQMRGIDFVNNRFFAVGSTKIYFSDDGMNWTAATTVPTGQYNAVAYDGVGRLFAVGQSGAGAYSDDNGVTWIESDLGGFDHYKSIAYGAGRFVAVAPGLTTFAHSTDGVTWTTGVASGASTSVIWNEVIYAGGRFVAVGSGSGDEVTTSTNGTSWTSNAGVNNDPSALFYESGQYVTVSPIGIGYSSNGTSWTTSPTGLLHTGAVTDLAYGNNRFVFVGAGIESVGGAGHSGEYMYDIASIGQDDASGLLQTQSRSVNPSSMVTISAAADQQDLEFFTISNNDDDVTRVVTSDNPSDGPERLAREWYVQETGGNGVGDVTLAFDLSQQTALPITGQAESYKLLIDNDGVFADAIVSTAASSFASNTVTFSGITELDDGEYFTLAYAASPGGIANNLEAWFDANNDANVFSDQACTTTASPGASVLCWQDKTGNGNQLTDNSTNDIKYRESTTDSNASYSHYFDVQVGDQELSDTSTSWTRNSDESIFYVAKADPGGSITQSNVADTHDISVSGQNDYQTTNGSAQNNIFGPAAEAKWVVGGATFPLSGTGAVNRVNNVEVSGASGTNVATDSMLLFVDDGGSNRFEGDFAEIFVYDEIVGASEIERIESYLSLKYGVSRDQTVATDYIASDGTTIIWDASNNTGYDNDIAGLGEDNGSAYFNDRGISQSPDALIDIDIDAPNSIDNLEFLTWANDDGNLSVPEQTNIPGGLPVNADARMTREWKLEEVGDVGTFDIYFDLSNQTALQDTATAGDYALLIDDDGDFSDATIHTSVSYTGGRVRANNVSLLDDGEYFTLAGPVAGQTVSGQALNDEGGAGLNGLTVALLLDGGSKVTTTTANNAAGGGQDGEYQFTGVDLSGTTVLTVFIDDETENGATVTLDNDADITGLDIIQDYLITRHETAGPIGENELDTGHDGDTDLTAIYNDGSSTGQLVVNAAEWLIPVSYTYTHAGLNHLDINANIDIDGVLNTGSRIVQLAGDFDNSGTFSVGNQIRFDTAGNYNLTFGGQTQTPGIIQIFAGNVTMQDAVVTNGLGLVAGSTLNLNGNNLTLTGSFTNDGIVQVTGEETTISLTQDTDSGTWEFIDDGDNTQETIVIDGTPYPSTYFNLIINNDDVDVAERDIFQADTTGLTINGDLNVTSGTLDTNDLATAVSGDVTLATNGVFDGGTSTVTLAGDDQTINGDITFDTLTKNAQTGGSTLTLVDGTDITISAALTLDGASGDVLTINSDVASPASTPTIDMTGASTFTGDFLDIENNTIVDNSSAFAIPANPASSTEGANANTTGWFYTQITNCTELSDVRNNLTLNYQLANDIDCSAFGNFTPIGTFATQFLGSIDGQGFTISDVTVIPASLVTGLFGYAGAGSSLHDFIIRDSSVTGDSNVGMLAGYSQATITRVGGIDNVVTNTDTGISNAGGLVAYNIGTGSIAESFTRGGSVTALSGQPQIGGLIGNANAGNPVTDSYSLDVVLTVGASGNVGGLTGAGGGNVTDSYAANPISGGTSRWGLASTLATVTTSYYDSEVDGIPNGGNGTPQTNALMRQQATFSGFDFGSTWEIVENATYPCLQWDNLCDGTFVTGTVYTDEGSTDIGIGKTVNVLVEGVSATTAETNALGIYSAAIAVAPSTNDIITVFIDDETEDGVSVSQYNTGNIIGLDVYQNYLTTRHETAGPLNAANLDTANNADTDITSIYNDGAGTLTVNNAAELLVPATYTFTPAEAIDTSGTLDIDGTFDAAANAVNVEGNLDVAGTLTTTGTVTLDGDDQTVTGDTSFGTLTKTAQTGGSTLTLVDGTDISIGTALTLDGASGDVLTINSDVATPVSTPSIDMTNASTFSGDFLDIENNTITDNSSAFATPVNPASSTEGANANTSGWFGDAPGGVISDLQLWLKADVGASAANWLDQSGQGNDTVASGDPVVVAGAINSNNTVDFDGTGDWYTTTNTGIIGSNNAYTKVAVVQERAASVGSNNNIISGAVNATSNHALYIPNGASPQSFHNGGGNGIAGPTLTQDIPSVVTVRYGSGAPDNIVSTDAEKNVDPSTHTFLDTGATQIGAYDSSSEQNGFIAEAIIYDAEVSDVELMRIESYLALKYGVTLDQGIAQNYVASDGSTLIWEAAANTGYDNDIAGIGQDDKSTLLQTQSRSENADSIVAVSGATDLQNLEFLTWGNDNGSTAAIESTDVPGGISDRLAREWKVDETGGDGVGDVTIAFDLDDQTALPNSGTAGDYKILIDDDGTFTDAVISTAVPSFNGNEITFTGVTELDDGEYFTVGTSTDITPPALVSYTSTTADATYGVGADINVTATYNENVSATATTDVVLDTGDTVTLTQAGSSVLGGNITVDTSFDPGTGVGTTIANEVTDIAEQSDGKLILVGLFTDYNGTTVSNIVRVNTDGSIDNTFNPGTGTNGKIHKVHVFNDDKIMISGAFSTFDGVSTGYIAKLNADGSRDTSFTGAANSTITDFDFQSDGKIIAVGLFTGYSGSGFIQHVARVNTNGTLDNTFNNFSTFFISNGNVWAVEVLPDDSVMIGGAFTTLENPAVTRNKLAKLTPNGPIDTGFADPNITGGDILDIEVQTDEEVIVYGTFTTINGTAQNMFGRINTDGTHDTGFASGDPFSGNLGQTEAVQAIEIQSDGKILLGGRFNSVGGVLTPLLERFNTDGTNDSDFNVPPTLTGLTYLVNGVRATHTRSDGQIMIGGDFTQIYSETQQGIAMLNGDNNGTTAGVSPTLVGTYTVGAGDSSSDLTVASISSEAVDDTSGNVQSSSTLPAGNNIADAHDIVIDTSVTVSGRLLDGEGGTGLNGRTLGLLLDGGSKVTTTTANNAAGGGLDGEYEFSGIDLSSTTVLTVFVDDETEDGVVVTRDDDAAITGLDVIQDYMRIANEQSGTINNDNLYTGGDFGGTPDTDITAIYSVSAASGGVLSTASGVEALVSAGDGYAPEGDLDLGGSLDIDGTIDLEANALALEGDLDVAGTFSDSSGASITMDGTTAQSFDHGSATITSNVVVANTAANVTAVTNAVDVNDFTINDNAVFDLDGQNLTVSGSFVNGITAGNDGATLRLIGSETTSLTQDVDSGTWEYKGDANGTADSYSVTDLGSPDYYNLTINDTDPTQDTYSKTGIWIDNDLSILDGRLDFNGVSSVDVNGDVTVNPGANLLSGSPMFLSGNITSNGFWSMASNVVTLDGDDQTFDASSGLSSFNSLTKTALADGNGSTLTLVDGSDLQFSGVLTLDGLAAPNQLTINSDVASPATRPEFTMNSFSNVVADNVIVENNEIVDSSGNFTPPVNPVGGVQGGNANTVNWFGLLVEFENTTDSSAEATASPTFNIVVQGANTTAIGAESIDVDIIGGTATGSSTDYTYTDPTTITIPAADYSSPTTIATGLTLVDDGILEGDETILMNLINPSSTGVIVEVGDADAVGGTEGSNTFTITDDETATIDFTAATANTAGDEDGTATPTPAVELDLTATTGTPTIAAGQTITADVTYNGSSTATNAAGNDITFSDPQSITFTDAASDNDTVNLSFSFTDDVAIEGPEQAIFDVAFAGAGTLNSASQTSIGATNQHTLTIDDDDGLVVAFTNAADSAAEATSSPTYTVTVSGAISASAETVQVDVTGGTATGGGTDYTYTDPTTINIPAANYTTPQTIAVGLALVDDNLLEGDETIDFALINPSTNIVVGTQGTNTFTITDDETGVVEFSAASSNTAGDEDGAVTVGGELTLTATTGTPAIASGETITVESAYNGSSTATNGASQDIDYSTPQTLTFTDADASGATKNLTFTLTDDAIVEGNETAIFDMTLAGVGTLNAATQTSLGTDVQHTMTIDDDDGLSIQFSAAADAGIEASGSNNLDLEVSGGVSVVPQTIDIDVTGGTATGSSTDYTFTDPTSFTIPAGNYSSATTLNQAITLVDDNLLEGDETILFGLTNPSSGIAAGTQSTQTFTITEDETASLQFINTASNTGGDEDGTASPTSNVQLALTSTTGTPAIDTGKTITFDVDYNVASTATNGASQDINFTDPTSLSFTDADATGATRSLSFVLTDDVALEGDETAIFDLSNLGGTAPASFGANTTHTLTINDDDTQDITGRLYSGQGTGVVTSADKDVTVLLNGVALGTDTTNGSGDYTVSTTTPINAGDVVTAYLEDEAENGVSVTLGDGSVTLGGLDVYYNHLVTKHDNAGPITAAHLDTANSGDTDITDVYNDGSGTLTINNSATLYIPASELFTPGVEIDTTGDVDIDGTLNVAAGSVNLEGSLQNNGSLTIGDSLVFDGAGSVIYANPNPLSADVAINKPSGTVQLNSIFNVPSGDLEMTAGTLDLNGNNFVIGDVDFAAGTFVSMTGQETVIIATSTQIESGWALTGDGDAVVDTFTLPDLAALGDNYESIVIDDTGATQDVYQLPNDQTVDDDFTQNGGTFNANSSNLTIGDDFNLTGGVFNLSTNNLVVNGLNTCTLTGGTFNQGAGNVTCAGNMDVSGTAIWNGGIGLIDVDGTFNLSGGTFTSTAVTFNLAGDFNQTGGTFAHNTGQVILDGVDQSVNGGPTFQDLSKNETTDDSTDANLTISSGTTVTIDGTLTLDGVDADDRLNIVASSSGTLAAFNVAGSLAITDFLDVSDNELRESGAIKDPALNPADSLSSNANVHGWFDDTDSDGIPDVDDLDDDGDGVPDVTEDLAPGSDGNGDGTDDKLQSNVASNTNPVTGAHTTMELTGSCVVINGFQVVAESDLAQLDPDADYPVGLKDFQIQCPSAGDSTTVKIYYDQIYDTSTWSYKKYDDVGNVFSDLTDIVAFGTSDVNGTTVTTASYLVTDGGATDTDKVANTVIDDPAGPAVVLSTSDGGLSETGQRVLGAVIVGLVLAGAVLILYGRRQGSAKNNDQA